MELADRLYVFCPNVGKGIEFIIQELPESIAKISGTLKIGEFLTSGYTSIDWNEEINGDIKNKNCIGLKNSENIKMNEGNYTATTIILSESEFTNLVRQMKNPRVSSYNKYKIFTLGAPYNKQIQIKKNKK